MILFQFDGDFSWISDSTGQIKLPVGIDSITATVRDVEKPWTCYKETEKVQQKYQRVYYVFKKIHHIHKYFMQVFGANQ